MRELIFRLQTHKSRVQASWSLYFQFFTCIQNNYMESPGAFVNKGPKEKHLRKGREISLRLKVLDHSKNIYLHFGN